MFSSLNAGALKVVLPIDELLTLAGAAGFQAIDLPIEDLLQGVEQSSLATVKDRFTATGVRAGAWGLPVRFRGDEEAFQSDLAALPGYARLAQALGSSWCATWILPFSDSLDFSANMDLHVRRLQPVCQILAEYQCRFGLEFVGPQTLRANHPHEFIHTIDGALDMARRIGTGNVGLLLDCFHWFTSQGSTDDLARLSASDVVSVHINDAVEGRSVSEQIDQERMLPGASGLIDITTFLQALERMGYDGPVAVEPFNAALTALPPAERINAAAASLQQVFTQAGL